MLAAVGLLALALVGCGARSRSAPPAGTDGGPTSATPSAAADATTTRAAGLGSSGTVPTASMATGADGVPRYDHIVIVVLENKPFGELTGTSSTPFLTRLAAGGAVLTQSYAITHPSEPNYLALFSGSTQGLTDDSCPHSFTGPNLAAALLAAGRTFVGYSESLPTPGFTGCFAPPYARKHAPWVDFPALPASTNQPMSSFPTDFTRLPSVAFVIPNLDDDMHDGTIAAGDRWLAAHLAGYAAWMSAHDSALVVTTDEDDRSHDNNITTVVAGAHVRPGSYPIRTTHYGVLRTVLDSAGLRPFGAAATTPALRGIWRP